MLHSLTAWVSFAPTAGRDLVHTGILCATSNRVSASISGKRSYVRCNLQTTDAPACVEGALPRRQLLLTSATAAILATFPGAAPAGMELDAAVDQSSEIRRHLKALLPGWQDLSDTQVRLEQVSGGLTNIIYKAFNDVTGQGAFVRIYGKDTDLLLDRKAEIRVFSELSDLGYGPKKLGEFEGGRIEELLDARSLKPAEMTETKPFDVPKAIATQLAKLHQQAVVSAGPSSVPVMWATIDRWLDVAHRLDDKGEFPVQGWATEVAWLKTQLPSPVNRARADAASQLRKLADSGAARSKDAERAAVLTEAAALQFADKVVFAHNDLLSGNILVGPKKGRVIQTLRLIDYEYSAYNYRGYDIANHLCECAGFQAQYERDYPTDSQVEHFLRCYVEAADPQLLAELRSSGLEERFFERLGTLVNQYALASHATWGLWSIIQAKTSTVDFDFKSYAQTRWAGYGYHKRRYFPSTR